MTTAAKRLDIRIFLGVMIFALAFAVATQHAWEDWWITFRASRNLATGHGLVFTPGERLHTFTSPLGTLLPALLSWVTGNKSDELVLWLFRVISAGALAGGVIWLYRALKALQLQPVSCLLAVALVGLDAKTVDFSINGMETGLQILFLGLTIHGLLVGGARQWLRLGMGWAGLMWTRPDGCVYIAILGACAFLFLSGQARAQTRVSWIKLFVVAGLVCTVVYLPWFIWAWSYYGSPIPHTVVAKGTNAPPLSALKLLGELVLFPATMVGKDTSLNWVFMPTYAWMGGWYGSVIAVAKVFGLIAVFAWIIPVLRPETRMMSLSFFFGNFFLTHVIRSYFPWYLPTVALFGYLTIGLLFDEALQLARRLPELGWSRGWFRHLSQVLRVGAVVLILAEWSVTACMGREMQVQQKLIENGLRRKIGLWLHDHAQPHDTVMLEPLGYIGYFSGLKMYDYPGLSSRKMVEVRKRLGPEKENQAYLILKPDWLVLRPPEARGESFIEATHLKELYKPVKVFDATKEIAAVRWLPGKEYLQFDQTFLVFHRRADADAKPAD